MPVMLVEGGRVWHVVHETLTHTRRTKGYSICRSEIFNVKEMRAGVPTCAACLALDNPFYVSDSEKSLLRRIVDTGQAPTGRAGFERLRRLDVITADGRPTRRGGLLLKDYREGPAAWADATGVTHARFPYSDLAVCEHRFENIDKMTLERYDKLRTLARPVSCIRCLSIGC